MTEVYVKKNVCNNEYKLYKLLQSRYPNFIPEFISYDNVKKELIMSKIKNLCISDMYGEKFNDIPYELIQQIRNIIKILYEDGFNYVDITGYNFIEDTNGKVWIIDFEHCFCKGSYNILNDLEKKYIKFIEDFIYNNIDSWNPDFL